MVAKRPNFCFVSLSIKIGEIAAIRVWKSKNLRKGDLSHFKKTGKRCTRTDVHWALRRCGAVHLPKKKASRSLAKKAISMKFPSTPDCMASQTRAADASSMVLPWLPCLRKRQRISNKECRNPKEYANHFVIRHSLFGVRHSGQIESRGLKANTCCVA